VSALSWRVAVWGGAVAGVANARTVWDRREGYVVELVQGTRRLGIGEATPLPGFGDDDLARAGASLVAIPPPERLPTARAELEAWLRALGELSASARFAVETSLLDAMARERGVPLGLLLGGSRRSRPRAVLLGGLADDDLFARARAAVDRGAQTLKLKVTGAAPDEESARIGELRRAVGRPVRVRLDLNGGLDPRSAHAALEHYARAGVELVEEPVSGRALLGLGRAALPWFADESLADAALCDELLDADDCAGVVLKPTLLGGLTRCAEIAARVARNGKSSIVSHAFEGPVALAAAAELSLSLDVQGDLAAGLDQHAALAAFPPARIAQLPRSAAEHATLSVEPAETSGLGIELDELAGADLLGARRGGRA